MYVNFVKLAIVEQTVPASSPSSRNFLESTRPVPRLLMQGIRNILEPILRGDSLDVARLLNILSYAYIEAKKLVRK